MIKKIIGTATVNGGNAEYIWEVPHGIQTGKRKLYVTYTDSDDYLLSENWENIYIKTPTNILFENEIIRAGAPNGEEPRFITLTVILNDLNTLEPVTEGLVQFQARRDGQESFTNIGPLVEVTDGVAVYGYELSEEETTDFQVKAIYWGTNKYSASETHNYCTVSTKQSLTINTNNIKTKPDQTETFHIELGAYPPEELNGGELSIILDNTPIYTTTVFSNSLILYDYTIPSSMSEGEHVFRIVYSGNNKFDEREVEGKLYIKPHVTIDDSPVYATPTLIENGTLIQQTAKIVLNITADGTNVHEGFVEFECNNDKQTIYLEQDSQEYEYEIPFGFNYGDEIPFTLTYLENENYQTTSITSSILLRHQTQVSVDAVQGNVGETVDVNATVVDENNTNVNEGQTQFEMETNIDDNNSNDTG